MSLDCLDSLVVDTVVMLACDAAALLANDLILPGGVELKRVDQEDHFVDSS